MTASKDGTARVWNVQDGTQRYRLEHQKRPVRLAVWNVEGSRIVTVSDDRKARVWDADRGTLVAILDSQTADISNVMWDPVDGSRIVTVNQYGTARVWRAEDGTELTRLGGHSGPVRDAVWNGAGTHIVTASDNGTARVQPVDIKDFLHWACVRAGRNMTEAEWRLYMEDEPYRKTCPDLPPAAESDTGD